MFENLSGKKVFILTLGCKVNQYESDAMMQSLKGYGCTAAAEGEPADIYIINSW